MKSSLYQKNPQIIDKEQNRKDINLTRDFNKLFDQMMNEK